MNKRKYLISSISMVMILFLVAYYQLVNLSSLSNLEQTTTINEISFILISIILVLAVVMITYYLPMILVFEFKVILIITLSPIDYISKKNYVVNNIVKPISKRYLRLNVIRC